MDFSKSPLSHTSEREYAMIQRFITADLPVLYVDVIPVYTIVCGYMSLMLMLWPRCNKGASQDLEVKTYCTNDGIQFNLSPRCIYITSILL